MPSSIQTTTRTAGPSNDPLRPASLAGGAAAAQGGCLGQCHPLGVPSCLGAPMRQTRALCLASASPRRHEMLERFGLTFVTVAPRVDETALPAESPAGHVARLAACKAEVARREYPGHVILAGDTVVVQGGDILGKPRDPDEAARMLTRLSGAAHRVLSAYCLLDAASGAALARTVETQVTFRRLPPEWIRWYSRLDEAQDKAGAYGIQGVGGAMVESLTGSYTNVVGLPIESVVWDLLEQGWLVL